MTKERREQSFYQEYMNLISKIPGDHFVEDGVHLQMQLWFKGMRRGGGYESRQLTL